MRVGVMQPGYLPWVGFFDQVDYCDAFILLEDVQYTKQDWRNRNRIKGPNGAFWLTVPVEKGSLNRNICKVRIADNFWQKKHVKSMEQCYRKAPFFDKYFHGIKKFYIPYTYLHNVNSTLITLMCRYLGIQTIIYKSTKIEYEPTDDKNLRLIRMLREVGCTQFYEGAAGKNYIDEGAFRKSGIEVVYQRYDHPYYDQLHGEFLSHMAIVDLLFNCGPESLDTIRLGRVK